MIVQMASLVELAGELVTQMEKIRSPLQYKQIETKMISKVKGLVKYTDMFYASEMLRHEDQQQYRTVTGGLLSIAIIVTTLVGFASMILQTLHLTTITTSTEIVKNDDPTLSTFIASPEQNFMFAAEIWLVNTTGTKRYFDVVLSQVIRSGEESEYSNLPLEPCTRAHWTLIPSLADKFEKLNVGNWLCPPIGLSFTMYGKYSSNTTSSYAITVSGCKNETDPTRPCAPEQQIDELFATFEQKFFLTVYYTNPIINPSRKEYKQYYLQDETYVIFGSNMGSEAFIYFTDYTIHTDFSIWPFKNVKTDEGVLVENHPVNHPYQAIKNGVYAQVFLTKSANSITYIRQVQKISSVFSFIGGMIGALSAVLFFVKSYTNLSFQISIASSIFRQKKDSEDSNYDESNTPLKMNVLTFLKYNVYAFCQTFGITLNWASIQYLKRCQQQIVCQLDIKNIIKRFVFIEHCLTHIFEDYQLDGLQMKTPSSLDQIKLIREKCVCVIDSQSIPGTPREQNINLEQGIRKLRKSSQLFNNNLQLERSESLESGFQCIKRQQKVYLQPNDILPQISMKQQSNHPRFSRSKNKTLVINKNVNAVLDISHRKSMIRQQNLHLLSLNSQMGNQLSKKILFTLSGNLKQKIGGSLITKKKLNLLWKRNSKS